MFGQVQRLDITLEHHGDFSLEVRWWADAAKTVPRAVSAVDSAVEAINGRTLLSLASMFSVAGNTMTLLVPASTVQTLAPSPDRRWYLSATDAATGIKTELLKGTAVVNE